LLRGADADSTHGDAVIGSRVEFNPTARPAEFAQHGGFYFDLPIPNATPEGWLTLRISAAGRTIGATPIDVRHFQPYSVRISPAPETWSGKVSDAGKLALRGMPRADYLYGVARAGAAGTATDAPASGLNSEVQVRVVAAKTPRPGCFDGFTFGHNPEDTEAQI